MQKPTPLLLGVQLVYTLCLSISLYIITRVVTPAAPARLFLRLEQGALTTGLKLLHVYR